METLSTNNWLAGNPIYQQSDGCKPYLPTIGWLNPYLPTIGWLETLSTNNWLAESLSTNNWLAGIPIYLPTIQNHHFYFEENCEEYMYV
jgi:hypothetical protein